MIVEGLLGFENVGTDHSMDWRPITNPGNFASTDSICEEKERLPLNKQTIFYKAAQLLRAASTVVNFYCSLPYTSGLNQRPNVASYLY